MVTITNWQTFIILIKLSIVRECCIEILYRECAIYLWNSMFWTSCRLWMLRGRLMIIMLIMKASILKPHSTRCSFINIVVVHFSAQSHWCLCSVSFLASFDWFSGSSVQLIAITVLKVKFRKLRQLRQFMLFSDKYLYMKATAYMNICGAILFVWK